MKIDIKKLVLNVMFGCTIIITLVNSLTLGISDLLFFPTANSLIVALVWLFQGFHSLPALLIALTIMCCMIFAFIENVFYDKGYILTSIMYFLDCLLLSYLLCYEQDYLFFIHIFIDVIIIILLFVKKLQEFAQTHARGQGETTEKEPF